MELGLNPDRVAGMSKMLPPERYSPEAGKAYARDLIERLSVGDRYSSSWLLPSPSGRQLARQIGSGRQRPRWLPAPSSGSWPRAGSSSSARWRNPAVPYGNLIMMPRASRLGLPDGSLNPKVASHRTWGHGVMVPFGPVESWYAWICSGAGPPADRSAEHAGTFF